MGKLGLQREPSGRITDVDGMQGLVIYRGAGWGESFDHERIRDFGTLNSSAKNNAEFTCDKFF